MNTTIKTRVEHYKLFVLILLASGSLSVCFGKELCWDLANYHYYLPFAWLNGRAHLDFWPNSYIHQFFNPAIDLLPYILITYFPPWSTEFILGAIHGINIWLLFMIASHFLREQNTPYYDLLAFALALLGIMGPTALPGIGSMQNDNFVSLFVLGFVLLQIKAFAFLPQRPQKACVFYLLAAFSGLILGLGLGFKFTLGSYVVGAGIASVLLPFPVKKRLLFTAIWSSCMVLGVLIIAGDWMWSLWLIHHNPFFPFLNGPFHSPDFLSSNWRDERFLPRSFFQTLFYPFYFAWDGRTSDSPFRDFRFPVVYVFFVITGIAHFFKREDDSAPLISVSVNWLFAFFIFSYVFWQYYFSIARYLCVLEMLCPLVIYLLMIKLIKNIMFRALALSFTFFILMYTLAPTPMVRSAWYTKNFFNVYLPTSMKNMPRATVLIAYPAYAMESDPRPQAYLIPFFPHAWRFIGVPFQHRQYLSEKRTTQQIRKMLREEQGPLFLLTSNLSMPALLQTAAQQFGLNAQGECEKIFSDRQWITHQFVLLCPVVMVGPTVKKSRPLAATN